MAKHDKLVDKFTDDRQMSIVPLVEGFLQVLDLPLNSRFASRRLILQTLFDNFKPALDMVLYVLTSPETEPRLPCHGNDLLIHAV